MGFTVFVISVLCVILLVCLVGLKRQLRGLRRQLEYRVGVSIKKPLALEMQDNDLMAITVALNQIFSQDEEFRNLQNRDENAYRELITNISHDLRTPLTVLKGYLQLLEHCDMDDTGRNYLSVCFRHTEELFRRVMQNLLKNCLQYSVGEVVVSITQDAADARTQDETLPMTQDKAVSMTQDAGGVDPMKDRAPDRRIRIGFYLNTFMA